MAEEIARELFQSDQICLAAIDPEEDAEILAAWSHNSAFMRAVDPARLRPQTAAQIKERISDQTNAESQYEFLIRMRGDGRILGFVQLERFQWIHRSAAVRLGIVDPADRRRGFGREALALTLHYAFGELNLHRLGAICPGYNQGAIAFLERMGFRIEVRRREALHRDDHRWELIHLGILAREWRKVEVGR